MTAAAKPPPAHSDSGSSGPSLTTRLMLAQGIVVAAGIVTAAVVAAIVGPALFHEHLSEAGQTTGSEVVHIEEAYVSANSIALSAALVIALTAAGVVTWYLARRMTRPLAHLAEVARRVSHGDYTARAPQLGAGPEIDELAASFNEVASRLQTIEDTRRRLLADLAHEMRTPLSTISAYLDGLDDELTTWTPQTSKVLRDQATRLLRLSQDLAEVSLAEEGRLDLDVAAVPIEELVRAAAQGVRPSYTAKGVTLLTPTHRSAGDRSGLRVWVDRERILQVLANLLTNALRHTPSGGTVTVITAPGPSGAGQSRQVLGGSNWVTVTVADTGEGIAAEQLPHIFERFYRGDTARDRDQAGSGIGLTIARSLANAHGGRLTAHSDGAGHGATLTLTLPATTSTAGPDDLHWVGQGTG
ncbi:MAG: sensor histidine kinase [Actinomycetales bacterium]